MVQTLAPKYNIGDQIGEALGKGIEKGADIGFQRGLLKDAFEKVRTISADPNASPLERNISLLEAFSLIPGSERYVGQVLPSLTQMAEFQGEKPVAGQTKPSSPIGENDNIVKPPLEGVTQEKKPPTMIINGESVPTPTESPYSEEDVDLYEPFLGSGVKKFSNEEISNREYADLRRGLSSSPMADFMRKQNQEIESAVDKISERQNSFTNYYNTTHPNMSPDDQRIAQKFYRTKDALNAPTNAEKTRIVDNFLDRYKSLQTNIAKQLPRDIIGKVRSDQEGEVRNQIQWLINEGQRDLAKQYITDDLGFGDSESERILRKTTQKEIDTLGNFPKLPELDVKVPNYGKSARLFQAYTKERTDKIKEYETRLQDAIKPGTAKNPGISLLVARDIAMDKTGMTWVEFNDTVNKLLSENKLKLDPYQAQELPKLTSAPYSGFLDMLIDRK